MSIFMDNWNLFWEGLENGMKTKESTPPPSPHSPPHVKILQDPVEIGVGDDYPEGDATSRTFLIKRCNKKEEKYAMTRYLSL